MPKKRTTTGAGEAISQRTATPVLPTAAPVVPGVEQLEDWEAHRRGILESLDPQGYLETLLAERVAELSWRRDRVTRGESVTMADAQETIEADISFHQEIERQGEPSPAERLEALQEERSLYQRLLDLGEALPQTPADTLISGPDTELLEALMPRLAASAALPPREALLMVMILRARSAADRSARTVSGAIDQLAALAKVDPADFRDRALLRFREHISFLEERSVEAAAEAEEVEAEAAVRIEGERVERLLPLDAALEKLVRYETHLSREETKALRELEAMQARRRGQPAPLARVDVSGVPAELANAALPGRRTRR